MKNTKDPSARTCPTRWSYVKCQGDAATYGPLLPTATVVAGAVGGDIPVANSVSFSPQTNTTELEEVVVPDEESVQQLLVSTTA